MIIDSFKSFLLSLGYFIIRRLSIIGSSLLSKNKDLEKVVSFGDNLLGYTNKYFGSILFNFKPSNNLETSLFDLEFASPITFASFKDDHHLIDIWLRLGIGGGSLKTILPHQHDGNPRPRLQEITVNGHRGLINHLGLPGKGVDALCDSLPS